MKRAFFTISLLALLIWACVGANEAQLNEDVATVDSTNMELGQQDTASVSELAEVLFDENVIMEIWDAYLNSGYCDITGDTKKARTQIKREGANVASLKLDEANAGL